VERDHPIKARFVVNEDLIPSVRDFISNDAEYVHTSLPTEEGTPAAFYKGFDLEWYPIEQNLDVRRNLTDTLLFDVILRSEDERPTTTEFYAIKAEAGAGKSTFLRRLAWEAADDALCIFFRKYGHIDYESLRELYRLTRMRIFLFIDDAADNVHIIESLLTSAKKDKLPLTLISAERINEWNMSCDRIAPYLTEWFQLRYLSQREIEALVLLLEKHNSLGYLKDFSQTQRIEAFRERAGRQILVALHEVTMGRPFEDILVDEYNEIRPKAAQSLYLAVCVLNRLNIPVRAGLISRTHGIPFTKFKERLFAPLEHVVRVKEDPVRMDYLYSARHPEIAAIVFDRILTSSHDRFNEYIRILAELNIAFTTDREGYRGLIRGKTLLDLFPDHQAVLEIFRTAERIARDDPYLYQQMGIYEMNRPNGNYERAHELIRTAKALDERDSSIAHSLSELARIRAEKADSKREKERYRHEAKKLATSLLSDINSGSYARHTIVKILMAELKELLQSEASTDREIDRTIENIEGHLEKGLQEHPNDPYLLAAESDFGRMLQDEERAIEALNRAFTANKRNTFVASRLSKAYEAAGNLPLATKTLRDALDANPNDRQLHYRYAMLLKESGGESLDTLIYHFRRGFTRWDSNYEAQFWFARYTFESSDEATREESKTVFRKLRDTPMAHDVRTGVRDLIKESGVPQVFTGTVVKKEDTTGFVQRDGPGDWLFFHKSDVAYEIWTKIRIQQRVIFKIGFSFSGAKAVELEPA